MSTFGLAKALKIDRPLASEYIQRYFQRYPGIRLYMENTRQQAREQKYVETIFGRKLHLEGLSQASHQQKQAMERAAINAPMQGSAADIIKRAMIQIHQTMQKEKWPAL